MSLKQVILVRKDLKLPKGKLAAQTSHASVEAVFNSEKHIVDEWRKQGMKKVVLKVEDKKELFQMKDIAENHNLKTAVITDAGKTVVMPGTVTCMAIGPAQEDEIDKITKHLKLV